MTAPALPGAEGRQRAQVIVFVVILVFAVSASLFLPRHLGLPAGVVQERIMLVLLPVFLGYAWWTR